MTWATTAPAAASGAGGGLYGARGLRLVRGRGATVYDADGRAFLDATSMYGTALLGHASPVVTGALAAQSERLVSCFASFGSDARDGLLLRLRRLAPTLDRAFLCNSGAEAVEAALKVARATTGRAGVVAAAGGFHGRTLGALSATHAEAPDARLGPLLAGVRAVPFGDAEALAGALDESVGLVLVEPIQGEGGVRTPPPGYLRDAAAAARANGSLVCYDEVQTGVGRTGTWFAHAPEGVTPDLITLAKGLAGGVPIGALLVGPAAADLRHCALGSTFGGNPLAAAVASAVLDHVEAEDLVEHAAAMGTRLLEGLRARHLARVRAVRGRGLLVGLELRSRAAPHVRALQDAGVLVLPAGPRVLRLLPPLTITPEEVERLLDALTSELER